MIRPSGKHILEVENLGKSYGDLKVFDGFSTALLRW